MSVKILKTRDTMTGPVGTATKDGKGYTIKSTKFEWKLVINAPIVSCKFVYSKKDLPTFETLKEYLTAEGYQVL